MAWTRWLNTRTLVVPIATTFAALLGCGSAPLPRAPVAEEAANESAASASPHAAGAAGVDWLVLGAKRTQFSAPACANSNPCRFPPGKPVLGLSPLSVTAKFDDADGGSVAFWVELAGKDCARVREELTKQLGKPDILGQWNGHGFFVTVSPASPSCQLSLISQR